MSTSGSDVKLAIDEGTQVWNLLADQVDAFLAAWREGTDPPKLVAFVPTEPPALRRLILVELIKVDLEHRWQNRRAPKMLEEYLAEFPELAPPLKTGGHDVPCDLIYEEFHVRRRAETALADPEATRVNAQQYRERFPDQAEELGRLLGVDDRAVATAISTAVYSDRRAREIKVGEQIDDFDLITQLGKGAFATVYLARQRSMQRLVALKVSSDKGDEPATLAQLDHPNIVRVYDQRTLPDRKLRLMYMQYVTGGTLLSVLEHLRAAPAGTINGKTFLAAIDRALIERGEQPQLNSIYRHKIDHASWGQVVCWLGARLAAALAYAHAQGVLHRDIKPANVLVAGDGSPKLADFNISYSSKVDGATPAAYFGGSLAYMSPEQLEACDPNNARKPEDLDGRSDVYSLAVMLWELLTGSRPFVDEVSSGPWSNTLAKMLERRRAGVTAEARAKLPASCPSGLEDALHQCLAPNAADRYASAAELSRQLDLCLQPRAQRMLQRPKSGWLDFPRRAPRTAVIVAGLAPNLAMCALNIWYNLREIIPYLSHEAQEVFFGQQMFVINAIAYILGVGFFFYVNWGVARTVSHLAAGLPVASESLAVLRERCLRMGTRTARLTLALWTVSGIAFPLWLQFACSESMRPTGQDYLKFGVSQVLCGMMASTLTFFCVTWLAVHIYYPRLAQAQPPAASEAELLQGLARRVSLYFIAAMAVPFLAVAPVALVEKGGLAVGLMGVIGLFSSALAFFLLSSIREDLAALSQAINPAGDSLAGGAEAPGSFWGGSR